MQQATGRVIQTIGGVQPLQSRQATRRAAALAAALIAWTFPAPAPAQSPASPSSLPPSSSSQSNPSTTMTQATAAAPAPSETDTPTAKPTSAPALAGGIEFVKETLPNGLRVIYAPMRNAPVVHVRISYDVGSRDERPDRQGFAHMFEHMMFRGSQHVAPQQHMRTVNSVGGVINAYTNVDETTYWQTIPASSLEKILWLEADRMSSFKVSDDIFKTERKVVAEEWRLNYANRPDGTLFPDFLRTAYTTHPYRWSPIGDMDHLRAATSAELQEFFNKYYIPNNAVMVIAGDIDVPTTAALVRRYFGWIPAGPSIDRALPAEPPQTQERTLSVYRKTVPLPTLLMGYKTTDYKNIDDNVALDAVATILGGGSRTSRLNKLLVNPVDGSKPVALRMNAGTLGRRDLSVLVVSGQVLPGNDPAAVEEKIKSAVAEFVATGPTDEELETYKVQSRLGAIQGRQTAEAVATQLARAELYGADASMVNTELELIEKLTPARVREAAAKYLRPEQLTVVTYLPDPTGQKARAAGQETTTVDASKADATGKADVVASATVVEPRPAPFPADYPTTPPANAPESPRYNLGTTAEVGGVPVITLQDARLPLVSFQVVLRTGSNAEPADKVGLASLTASLMRRGAGTYDNIALAKELEANGVSIDISAGTDTTVISGTATSEKLDYAVTMAALVASQPTMSEKEFDRLKLQAVNNLKRALVEGPAAADRELRTRLWGGTVAGRQATPEGLESITLADVKNWYTASLRRAGAFIVFAGDVSPQRAQDLSSRLVAAVPEGAPAAPVSDVSFDPAKRTVVLIDNPDARQSNIRVGFRTYNLQSEDRFAGAVATQVLSSGIDSRMNKYLRADRGLTYGASAVFSQNRTWGEFISSVNTNPATTVQALDGVFTVLEGMRSADITDDELAFARSRAAGLSILATQTIDTQADRRAETILNKWPADYYEKLPQRIAAVTKGEVRKVMSLYADPAKAVIVVVGPAATIKDQLTAQGNVEVIAMPLARKPEAGATNQ